MKVWDWAETHYRQRYTAWWLKVLKWQRVRVWNYLNEVESTAPENVGIIPLKYTNILIIFYIGAIH